MILAMPVMQIHCTFYVYLLTEVNLFLDGLLPTYSPFTDLEMALLALKPQTSVSPPPAV